MRNEYMMVDGGQAVRPVPKSYVEAYCQDGVPIRSNLVELEGPPAPPGYIPDSLYDVLPEVRRLLSLQQSDREAWHRADRE